MKNTVVPENNLEARKLSPESLITSRPQEYSIKKDSHTINNHDPKTPTIRGNRQVAFPSPSPSIPTLVMTKGAKVSEKEEHQKQKKQYGSKYNTGA